MGGTARGKSSGRPTEAGCYAAGEAAYRWLQRFLRISGMGHMHPVGAEFYAQVHAFLDGTRP